MGPGNESTEPNAAVPLRRLVTFRGGNGRLWDRSQQVELIWAKDAKAVNVIHSFYNVGSEKKGERWSSGLRN